MMLSRMIQEGVVCIAEVGWRDWRLLDILYSNEFHFHSIACFGIITIQNIFMKNQSYQGKIFDKLIYE